MSRMIKDETPKDCRVCWDIKSHFVDVCKCSNEVCAECFAKISHVCRDSRIYLPSVYVCYKCPFCRQDTYVKVKQTERVIVPFALWVSYTCILIGAISLLIGMLLDLKALMIISIVFLFLAGAIPLIGSWVDMCYRLSEQS